MAVALESSNRVWQRVRIALAGSNEATYELFKALKKYLATQKGNPQLQFLPINGVTSSSDGTNTASQILVAGACTLYGVYGLKNGSTEAILKLSASATTAGTDGTQDSAIAATAAGDVVELYPNGRAFAGGITVTENTTRTGSTLTLKANRIDGFVLIGQ